MSFSDLFSLVPVDKRLRPFTNKNPTFQEFEKHLNQRLDNVGLKIGDMQGANSFEIDINDIKRKANDDFSGSIDQQSNTVTLIDRKQRAGGREF